MSPALNSKWNLSWEPLFKVHWAAQQAAPSPTATEDAGTFFILPLQKSQPSTEPSSGQCFCRKLSQDGSSGPPVTPSEIWTEEVNTTEDREQGDISLGFWTQGEAGCLSLGHAQDEEGGLSPTLRSSWNNVVGGRGRWTAVSPFFSPKALSISWIFRSWCHFPIKHTTQGLEHGEHSISVGADNIDGRGGAGTCVPHPAIPRISWKPLAFYGADQGEYVQYLKQGPQPQPLSTQT